MRRENRNKGREQRERKKEKTSVWRVWRCREHIAFVVESREGGSSPAPFQTPDRGGGVRVCFHSHSVHSTHSHSHTERERAEMVDRHTPHPLLFFLLSSLLSLSSTLHSFHSSIFLFFTLGLLNRDTDTDRLTHWHRERRERRERERQTRRGRFARWGREGARECTAARCLCTMQSCLVLS